MWGVKIGDARDIVEAARVDPTYYSFDGDRHDALCIIDAGGEWRVFLSERGSRHEERTFGTEDEACVWFLRRLFTLWRPRCGNTEPIRARKITPDGAVWRAWR